MSHKSLLSSIANTESQPSDSNKSDGYSNAYFDAMYTDSSDPWQYQTRWYEQRKRDMCLAVLPQAHYESAIELGCGNGVFSELLAHRCTALCCVDGNEKAVHLAKQRLVKWENITVQQGIVPDVLRHLNPSLSPNKTSYDLIIISEILYYLSPYHIDTVIHWIVKTLAKGGTLLCCHWRYPIDGFEMTGETVHQRLDKAFGSSHQNGANPTVNYTLQSHLIDSDFLLNVWQNSPKTVAMQEGLVI